MECIYLHLVKEAIFMTFLNLVKKRQSVRKYSSKPVDRDLIESCVEAARLAPSACNSQPWEFIVVDNPELLHKAAEETFGKVISFNHFSLKAPVLIVLILKKPIPKIRIGNIRQNINLNLIDIGIAAEHLCLQAADKGLGTCMLGWFNEKTLKKVLNIKTGEKIALVITMGYPESEEIRIKKRKPLKEILRYDRL